jgi:hypothetical protein
MTALRRNENHNDARYTFAEAPKREAGTLFPRGSGAPALAPLRSGYTSRDLVVQKNEQPLVPWAGRDGTTLARKGEHVSPQPYGQRGEREDRQSTLDEGAFSSLARILP